MSGRFLRLNFPVFFACFRPWQHSADAARSRTCGTIQPRLVHAYLEDLAFSIVAPLTHRFAIGDCDCAVLYVSDGGVGCSLQGTERDLLHLPGRQKRQGRPRGQG